MSFEIKFVALTIINFHYFIVKMLKKKTICIFIVNVWALGFSKEIKNNNIQNTFYQFVFQICSNIFTHSHSLCLFLCSCRWLFANFMNFVILHYALN